MTPDPPVIFAGKWAKKYIRELEAERDRLNRQNADLRATIVAARIRLPSSPEAALLILSGDKPTPERVQMVRNIAAFVDGDDAG